MNFPIKPTRTELRRRALKHRPQVQGLEGRQLLSAGDLDPTFGSGGFLLTGSPAGTTSSSPSSQAYAVAVQPDGTILASGEGPDSSGVRSFSVARLTSSGSLDPSFGSGGRALPLAGGPSYDMAVQSDGRIVLAGFVSVTTGTTRKTQVTQWDVALVRLLPNGQLDASFGSGGKVITGFSTSGTKDDVAMALAIQADGKIVVGGWTKTGTADDTLLARHNADGSLDDGSASDTTPGDRFGTGGRVVNSWAATGADNISGLAIEATGKIVVSGASGDSGTDGLYARYIARYNADGSLDDGSASDTTPGDGFGTGGRYVLPFRGGLGYYGHSVTLQPDGSIVTVARSVNGSDTDVALVRLTPAGTLDPSFGGGAGLVTLPLPGKQGGRTVAVQPDGRIVVVGTSDANSFVARFLPDGAPDTGFGRGGSVAPSFSTGSEDALSDVAFQADGKIVAVGSASKPSSTVLAFVVARFLGDPSPLLASAPAPTPVRQELTAAQARPALAQALSYWRARGVDTSRLGHIDLAVADLGGNRLGEASGSAITLDDNAAGWGWDTGRGRRASGRMDLTSALVHEVGHLLGHEHAEGGVMAGTLAPGARSRVQALSGPASGKLRALTRRGRTGSHR